MGKSSRRRLVALSLAAVTCGWGGCVSNRSSLVRPANLPPPPPATTRTEVLQGVVVSSKPVDIAPETDPVKVTSVLGAIGRPRQAANVIGQATRPPASPTKGEEVTVRLDSGKVVTVIQERRGLLMETGDRVRVINTVNEQTHEARARVILVGEPDPDAGPLRVRAF